MSFDEIMKQAGEVKQAQMKAVQLVSVVTGSMAMSLRSSSVCKMGKWPRVAAAMSRVQPELSALFGSALCSSSSSTAAR